MKKRSFLRTPYFLDSLARREAFAFLEHKSIEKITELDFKNLLPYFAHSPSLCLSSSSLLARSLPPSLSRLQALCRKSQEGVSVFIPVDVFLRLAVSMCKKNRREYLSVFICCVLAKFRCLPHRLNGCMESLIMWQKWSILQHNSPLYHTGLAAIAVSLNAPKGRQLSRSFVFVAPRVKGYSTS